MLFRFAFILPSLTYHSAFYEANGRVLSSALDMTQMTRMTANL